MNEYFYRVWIPLQIATLVAIIQILLFNLSINWWIIFVVWFLIGPIGSGVGYHKLFSHRQFNTYKPIEYILAILGTLSAYAPLGFFIGSHSYHHKNSDSSSDPSSPLLGIWRSFFWWRLSTTSLKQIDLRNYCFNKFLNNSILRFISKRYDYIIASYVGILFLIFGWIGVINFFLIPVFIEHMRINVINSISHMKFPLNYRNFDTTDNSYNNYVFGILSMGFGWHNNHHQDQISLINSHKWWEIDIEGLISTLIAR